MKRRKAKEENDELWNSISRTQCVWTTALSEEILHTASYSKMERLRKHERMGGREDWKRPKIIHLLRYVLSLPLPINTPCGLGFIPSYPVERKSTKM